MATLIPGAGTGSLLDAVLLADDRAIRIGAIHRIDYTEAVVLTHDKWKHEAGGIPQFCFLLATARDVTSAGYDDDEVLLLRVEGTAPLAMEADLHAVREESLRNALAESDDPSPSVVLDMDMDPFTKNRVSYTGLRCKILGTFYEEDINGQKRLQFGADVDNFYATSTYRVLKPLDDGLSAITSYLKTYPDDEVEKVRIGTVRYASTRRRALASGEADAPVEINIHDFIGHKTAMFGMTRMGKSNTAKTIIARTQAVSQRRLAEGGRPVGQLVLDPQGEYANSNTQDGTEIAAIGVDKAIIYKFGADGSEPNVRPLGINFFDPDQLDAVKGFVSMQLADSNADYVRAFASADLHGNPRVGESTGQQRDRRVAAERGRLMLYGALARADFQVPSQNAQGYPWDVGVTLRQPLVDAINKDLPGEDAIRSPGGQVKYVRGDRLIEVCEWIAEHLEGPGYDALAANVQGGLDSLMDDDPFRSVLPMFTQSHQGRFVSGYSKLKPLREFHTPAATSDYRDDVYEALVDGMIVIIDLHLGPPEATSRMSEDLAARIKERQTEAFTSGQVPPSIQLVVEEAHTLFGRDAFRKSDDLDVWVRLAKEASKLNLGLLYATQEVTSVAQPILANTKNWVVAHLNNTNELTALSKFYDFGSFQDAIIASEDKGYVRLKTMSSPFIVPVQIDRYGLELVNKARAAAGDEPLVEIAGVGAVPRSEAGKAAQSASVQSSNGIGPAGAPTASAGEPGNDADDRLPL